MLHEKLVSVIAGFAEVQNLVGKNESYSDAADQLAIRPGQLDEDDPFPGIVISVPIQQHDKDLDDQGSLIDATVEVTCVSESLSQAWALRSAVAFNGGQPNDSARSTGLDGYTSTPDKLWGAGLVTDEEESYNKIDGGDRLLWAVTSTYQVSYQE